MPVFRKVLSALSGRQAAAATPEPPRSPPRLQSPGFEWFYDFQPCINGDLKTTHLKTTQSETFGDRVFFLKQPVRDSGDDTPPETGSAVPAAGKTSRGKGDEDAGDMEPQPQT